MKNILSRRLSAAAFTSVLLFVTVLLMSIFANAANAASTFTPRLTAPDKSNSYYYSDKNVYHKYGYGMPNCTAYAFGRAYEILGKEPNLSHFMPNEWYGYNKDNGFYDYGQTPKLGAIACWSYSGGGHVAVVEKIENDTVTFSNSEWGGRTFYLTTSKTTDANFGGNSWWTFQGFIYIGDFSQPSTESSTSNDKSTGIYRTDVDDYLNMRSGAGTSYGYVASIPNGVSLAVTKVTQSGGYTWGYTDYNGKAGWIALDFCVYVSPLPTEPPTTEPTTTEPPTTEPITSKPTEPPVTEPTTEKPPEPTTKPQGLGVGDVNYDGVIDIKDATEIQKHLAELVTFTDEQVKFADFDFDGSVSIVDSTKMQKYIVQLF